jgi:hypothetical protein
VVFVSCSRKDARIVLPLVRLLRASGHEVFVDQDNLEFGSDWDSDLASAIGRADRFILFWSRASRVSGRVEREVELALASPGCRIIPVALDGSVLPDQVRRFHGTTDLKFLVRALRRQRAAQVALWLLPLVFALSVVWWSGPYRPHRILGSGVDPESLAVLRRWDLLLNVLVAVLLVAPLAAWLVFRRRARALYARALAALTTQREVF